MKRIYYTVLILILVSCSGTTEPCNCVNPFIDYRSTIIITRVYDGDTYYFKISNEEIPIRLLNADCFEVKRTTRLTDQATKKGISVDSALQLGLRAKFIIDSLITGKEVVITRDSTQDNFDVYGRLLRHVFYNNQSLSAYLKELNLLAE